MVHPYKVLLLFFFLGVIHSFTVTKQTNEILNLLGPINGNCSRESSLIISDLVPHELLSYSVQPNFGYSIFVTYENASAKVVSFQTKLPFGPNPIAVSLDIASNVSQTVTLNMLYECTPPPIPIVKNLGFFYPMEMGPVYYYMLKVENTNAGREKIFYAQTNHSNWAAIPSFYSMDIITIRLSNSFASPPVEVSYVEVMVRFSYSNNYDHYVNVEIPLLAGPLQISNLVAQVFNYRSYYYPFIFQATQNLPFKRKLYVIDDPSQTRKAVASPVYGTLLNATYQFVMPVVGSTFNTTLWEIRQLDYGLLANERIFTTTPTYTNYWPLGPSGFEVVLYPEGSGSLAIVSSQRSNITRVESAFFFSYQLDSLNFYYSRDLMDGRYGMTGGNYSQFTFESSIWVSIFDNRPSFYLTVQGPSLPITNPNPYTLDNIPPFLTDLKLITIPGFNRYIIARITVTDDRSGFRYLSGVSNNNLNGNMLISSKDIFRGTGNDGVYETVIENPLFSLNIYSVIDYSSNSYSYGPEFQTTEQDRRLVFSNPPNSYVQQMNPRIFSNVTLASWSHNDIDVSNSSFTTIFRFNATNPDKDLSPFLDLLDFGYQENTRFFGQWNDTIKQYEVPVIIPLRAMSGVVTFKITYFKAFDSGFLNNIFPLSTLRIHSDDADMFGPTLEVTRLIDITDGALTIGWSFKVSDRLNGFHSGHFSVVSERHQNIYEFVFDPAKETNNFTLHFPHENCLSQIFYISNVYLRDNGGYISDYNRAFIDKLDDNSISIDLTCPPLPEDLAPPTLSFMDFQPNAIDVGSKERVVTFTFTIQDTGNGLLLEKLPFVYLSSNNEIAKEKATLLDGSTPFKADYSCSFTVPYGFGYPGYSLVSIYGSVDVNGNYGGFSSQTIKGAGFSYILDTSTFSFDADPLIESNAYFTNNGGKLMIMGKSFGTDNSSVVQIDYNDTSGYSQTSTPSFSTPSTLIINDVKPTNTSFKIQIIKSKNALIFYSNEFWVHPFIQPGFPPQRESSSSSSSSVSSSSTTNSEEIPTQAPNQCLNNCGGPSQGYCSATGCICHSPWMGIDCKSKVIIIPTPSINNTTPSTNVTVPTDNSEKSTLTGLISIVELRELDKNYQLVYKYPFTQWIWSDISTDNEPV
ncbi:hypothetical protein CYY_003818, partial [Polysphondylium violaceum]